MSYVLELYFVFLANYITNDTLLRHRYLQLNSNPAVLSFFYSLAFARDTRSQRFAATTEFVSHSIRTIMPQIQWQNSLQRRLTLRGQMEAR